MKYFCIGLFLFVTTSCNAQDKNVSVNKEAIALNNEAVQVSIYGSGNRHDRLIRANQLLDSAIKIDRSCYLAYTNKIQNLVKLKQYHQALAWSDSVLNVKPDLAEVLTGKGLIYDKLGDTSRAQMNYIAGNPIYESRYASNHNINNLKGLAFNYYLSYGKSKAFELLDQEKYRFKNSHTELEEINKFKTLVNKVTKDELLGQ